MKPCDGLLIFWAFGAPTKRVLKVVHSLVCVNLIIELANRHISNSIPVIQIMLAAPGNLPGQKLRSSLVTGYFKYYRTGVDKLKG